MLSHPILILLLVGQHCRFYCSRSCGPSYEGYFKELVLKSTQTWTMQKVLASHLEAQLGSLIKVVL